MIGQSATATFLAIVKGDASQAVTEFNRMGSAVTKSTTGATASVGKFKTMTSGAFTEIKANAALLSGAAVAGIAAFTLKAANKFSDLAKASIDLGKATGFSTEQASRWIAVADDYEVSADSLAGAVGRIDKSLNDEKWARYGIATKDASGHTRSANDIFLDTLDLLSKTDNETDRATIAAELMGRGYQALAPIFGKTRAELEDMLATVEDGQVITDAEAERGEKWRLAMDQLSDSLGEFALAVGGAAVKAAPLINLLAKGVEYAGNFTTAFDPTAQVIREAGGAAEEFAALIVDATGSMYSAATAAGELIVKTDGVTTSLSELMDELNGEKGLLQIQDGFDDLKDKSLDAWYAAASGAEDAEDKLRIYQIALIDQQLEVGEYAEQLANLPEEEITNILALIDQQKFDVAESRLNFLARNRSTYIRAGVIADASLNNLKEGRGAGANGGIQSGWTLVGERGPEVVNFSSPGRVYTNNESQRMLGGSGGPSVIVNNYGVMGGTPAEVGGQIMDLLEAAGKDGRRMTSPVAA